METQYNTDLANFFDRASLDGWANMSDGNVECNSGHFSMIIVTEAEKAEFMDALADEDEMNLPVVGNWLLVRDSNGNRELHKFDTRYEARTRYKNLLDEFTRWDATDCPKCNKTECLEPHCVMGCCKKCVACGHVFDPAKGV